MRVMALVSTFLHRAGIRIRCYLDDWLIQASSRSQVRQAVDTVLRLCQSLGIVVNWEKSHLEPLQKMVYLSVLLDLVSFRASPAQKSREALLSRRGIFVLHRAACRILVGARRGIVIPDSSDARRPSQDALSPASSSSFMGPAGRFGSCLMGLGVQARSGVVAGQVSSGGGRVSSSGVPEPQLLV